MSTSDTQTQSSQADSVNVKVPKKKGPITGRANIDNESSRRDVTYSCHLCQEADTEDMVQCDICDKWFHFHCVKVDESVAYVDWSCKRCQSKEKLNQGIEKKSTSVTSVSRRQIYQLELEKLEEEKAIIEKQRVDELDLLDRKYRTLSKIILEDELQKENSERADTGSHERSKRTGEWIQSQQKRMAEASRRIPVKHVSIIESDRKEQEETLDKTEARIIKNRQECEDDLTAAKNSGYCVKAQSIPGARKEHKREFDDTIGREEVYEDLPTYRANNMTEESNMYGINHELSSQQLAARQALSLKSNMPVFSGNPEDWPLFYSNYLESTRRCGYTNQENLIRLQQSLKGKALEAVRSMLLVPDNVSMVVENLRLLFGRPEVIINTLITKIRNEKPIRMDRMDSLVNFAIMVQNLIATMEASKLAGHLNNPVLLQELISKLPASLKLDWARHTDEHVDTNLMQFNKWLYQQARAASKVSFYSAESYKNEERWNRKETKYLHATHTTPSKVSGNACSMCRSQLHQIVNCSEFINSSKNQRWKIVKEKKLCRHCLGSHYSPKCRNKKICNIDNCNRQHHPLLHNSNYMNEKQSSEQEERTVHKNGHYTHCPVNMSVLFRIIPVRLFNQDICIETFAFLDDGSSVSLMEESLARELKLNGPSTGLYLQWSNDISHKEEKSMTVSCQISGTFEGAERHRISNIRTVKKLGLPIQSYQLPRKTKQYQYLQELPLESYVNASPKLLIGLDNLKLSVPLEIREERNENLPVATRTRLGWVLSGPYYQEIYERKAYSFHICECQNEDNLHKLFKEFSSLENFGIRPLKQNLESKEDNRARDILKQTTVKKNKRFETGLIWKQDNVQFPDSFFMAFKRLLYLEKKMLQDEQMAESLKKQMKEYEVKNYIRKLTPEEINSGSRVWYLPMFIVKSKPNKMRIVWDAAAQVDGVSLNSMLLPGPDLMSPLISILHRFRQGKFAISGDIKEMFHQVCIREEDQNSQRFLWRDGNPERKPEIYVMQVMTFGATCSPSSAQYVKNINAEEFRNEYPRAVKAIQHNHYVDDWLDSFDSEDEAMRIAEDVRFIHFQGGFQIRNWMSNSKKILSKLKEAQEVIAKNLDGTDGTRKILGMWWDTKLDAFIYKINQKKLDLNIIKGSKCPTKREVLRTLMCIYDPLGLIANILIYLKILLQDIWRSGINWDEQITEDHDKRWKTWTAKLWSLENLQISRHYGCSGSSKNIELHTFVDASEHAYSAVVYLRIINETETHCALIGSKAKVAPQKPISIPRLELLAAVLGARLTNSIEDDLTLNIDRKFYWTDSKTVLHWLKSDARKYRQFVGLRIGELLELTSPEEWRWVPTNQNVADEATKWRNEPKFSSTSRWFCGPQFLAKSSEEWPLNAMVHNLEDDKELKATKLVHLNINIQEPITPDISRFSKWRRLVRAQAYFLRSVVNFKALKITDKSNKILGPLQPEEIKAGEMMLYRKAQWDHYRDEIVALNIEPCNIDRESQLYKMNPYLEDGILRIQGRIDAAEVQYDTKRPIILPSKHPITNLIIKNYHEEYHHQNNEIVINEIRQKYFIPKLRIISKKIRENCQKCKNDRAKPKPPLMGELPKARLASFCKPFTYVGVDYFGPMVITVGRRNEKRWGVIFTCLTIRAIHLEIAKDLTTTSCILCLKQFIFTRGCPLEIYSDNGTNFRGAKNELDREIQKIEESRLIEYSPKIKWRFNPPVSPHMGGSWERLIRSVKSNLTEILETTKPTEEVLRCCLKEVEFIINSRPLTYMSLDSEESEALTPNHFLLGTSSGSKSPVEFHSDETTLKNDWRTSQMMVQRFWKRWVREYLPDLTRRTKWFEPAPTLKIGDVVVIIDPNNPRNVWPKGRIIDVIRGKDGQVRSAVVKTQHGMFTRPAVKIAVLDVL